MSVCILILCNVNWFPFSVIIKNTAPSIFIDLCTYKKVYRHQLLLRQFQLLLALYK